MASAPKTAPQTAPHEFAFVDGDRTFTCRMEEARGLRDAWWWVSVSTEPHQRHAPFRASPADTSDGVQKRVVAYYDDLLARRAAPPQPRWQQRRPTPATTAAVPADAPAADAEQSMNGNEQDDTGLTG